MYVMVEGWAYRYKTVPNRGRQIVEILMPGDCCDIQHEMFAEVDHGIRTLAPSRVAIINRNELDEMLDGHPKVAKAIYLSQLIDEGMMRAWITSMARRSSIQRVAQLLYELYLRATRAGLSVDPLFKLPLSQVQLADALGMTPVHLNRVVKELRTSGAIVLGRSSVEVTDPVKLTQFAGFDENYLHRRQRLR